MAMMMEPTFRWYGPNDSVPLDFVRQTGAEGVVTALHHVPCGEVWTVDEIQKRQQMCADHGLRWSVVESLPVPEDVKTRSGRCEEFLEKYCVSLRNLGKCGIHTVTYNFMPVLDWVRTDLRHRLPDGSEALYFNQAQFAAFDVFILKRKNAEADFTREKLAEAEAFYKKMTPAEVEKFTSGIIDNFPGFKGVSLQDVRNMLARYSELDRPALESNMKHFLDTVCPAAEEAGIVLTIHPDDPPYPILGLPRIFSTASDIRDLLARSTSKANGICFCSGSFSARPDNDLVSMFKSCAPRVGFVHLRSTARDGQGNFCEANHLEGSVDMYALVKAVLEEQFRRRSEGREDWRIPFRPDHGHTMMDDLSKPPCANPGYTAIGRMKGMAELRGLELGILRSCF